MTNDLYPGAIMVDPMRVSHIPDGKEYMFPQICNSGEYFAEIKRDGACYTYNKAPNAGYLFGRTISKETGVLTEKGENVPHIMDALSRLPDNTVLVGEICYLDLSKSSKDITSIMGCLPDKAIERQKGEYGYVHYYIHDILYYNGINLMGYGASVRYQILEKVYEKHKLFGYKINGEQFLNLAERVDTDIQEAVSKALRAGHEGMVLKKKNAPYEPGKRPAWAQIKIKKTDTCDAVCIGACNPTVEYDGKLDVHPQFIGKDANEWPYWAIFRNNQFYRKLEIGEQLIIKSPEFITKPVTKAYYYGWKTAIEIGAYDEKNNMYVSIGTVSSGLTDEIREGLSKHPDKYMFKVVELAGMEKNNQDHTLRHFFLKQFRDDKNPKECTIKEIFD